MEFDQGNISCEMWLEHAGDVCLLLLAADPQQGEGGASDSVPGQPIEFELAVGLNALGAPYGFAIVRNYKWEPLMGSGQGAAFPTGRWVPISIKAIGSTVDLTVDGVRVLSVQRALRKGPIGLFMQGIGPVRFRNWRLQAKRPLCFAVMQFSPDFDQLYEKVIKEQCEAFGYEVVRADEFYTPGHILDDITKSIREAALVIADVTPDNANVYYELGYAHGLGKQTILLCDKRREKLPFDISGYRTVFYDNSIGGKSKVEERLRQFLEVIRPR